MKKHRQRSDKDTNKYVIRRTSSLVGFIFSLIMFLISLSLLIWIPERAEWVTPDAYDFLIEVFYLIFGFPIWIPFTIITFLLLAINAYVYFRFKIVIHEQSFTVTPLFAATHDVAFSSVESVQKRNSKKGTYIDIEYDYKKISIPYTIKMKDGFRQESSIDVLLKRLEFKPESSIEVLLKGLDEDSEFALSIERLATDRAHQTSPPKQKRTKKILLTLIALLVIYLCYITLSIYNYSKVNEIVSSDVAIVLGASVLDEEPSPVFRERINHGIWLYENGYVDKIIFTGGFGQGNEYSDSHVALKYAIENGVPAESIFIEEKSTITQENISYAMQIMEENNLTTAILVSDPLHMRRAMTMAQDYGLTAYSSPTPTTMIQSRSTRFPFLAREVFFYTGYRITRHF